LDKCNMPLCSICDDGGELILCEGVCMRSFHPKDCLDMDEVPDRQWYCPHCRLHVQPCAFCKKEDKSFGSDKKVYKCAEYTCGCYYHPDHLPGDSKRLLMEGQWFCYRHFCSVCGQFELNASKLVKCVRFSRRLLFLTLDAIRESNVNLLNPSFRASYTSGVCCAWKRSMPNALTGQNYPSMRTSFNREGFGSVETRTVSWPCR